MGRVTTNSVGLNYCREASLGVLPGSPSWRKLEPNDINKFGSTITTVSRTPISKARQRRKGVVTDLDSSVEFEADLTMRHLRDFVEGFCFATATNADLDMAVTACVASTTNAYTVAALSAGQAGKLKFSSGEYATLIFVRGCGVAANNGLKQLKAAPSTSDTAIGVSTDLTAETTPANAALEVAGVRSLASAADLTWTWDGTSKTAILASAGDITDWSALGLVAGQHIHVGSLTAGGAITNAFENAAANDMYGMARIRSMSGGSLTLDRVDTALQHTDGSAPSTAVDILFGKYIRNVAVDDSAWLEQSFQFELESPNLASNGDDRYEYALGNYCDTMAFDIPLADKAKLNFGFVGTDTNVPTDTRATNASSAVEPAQTGAFSSSIDIARLRLIDTDEDGLSTDFKSLKLTINNNVSAEKRLGTLGAAYMNVGTLEVDLEAQLIFTNEDVCTRIRENTTVSLDFALYNDDGGFIVDIPEMTLGGGDRDFPANQSVLINTTAQAHKDALLGTSVGISVFPYLPRPA
jgi:hypothetical protein